MANPNPSRITDNFYRLWTGCTVPNKRLGGMYANKIGYHNTRNGNPSNNYSVILPLDKKGPGDKTAGFDLTLPNTQMKLVGQRIDKSIHNSNDPRLNYLRECYGTLDGFTVYGKIHDSLNGTWRGSSANSSHLWHWHYSLFRAYVNSREAVNAVLSVINGETVEQWVRQSGRATMGFTGIHIGDEGQEVKELQYTLVDLGFDTVPANTDPDIKGKIRFDGIFGDGTKAAYKAARNAWGASDPNTDLVTGWFSYRAKKETAKQYGISKVELLDLLDERLENYSQVTNEVVEQIKTYIIENREEFRGEPGKVIDTILIEAKVIQ